MIGKGEATFAVGGKGEVVVEFNSMSDLSEKVDVLVNQHWPNVPECVAMSFTSTSRGD